jgi:hypothetical protein
MKLLIIALFKQNGVLDTTGGWIMPRNITFIQIMKLLIL